MPARFETVRIVRGLTRFLRAARLGLVGVAWR